MEKRKTVLRCIIATKAKTKEREMAKTKRQRKTIKWKPLSSKQTMCRAIYHKGIAVPIAYPFH